MRLFAALALNDEVRGAIAAEQQRILTQAPELKSAARWVQPAQMHLTLVFMGEVAPARVPGLADALAQPIDRPPFELMISGIGMFPTRGAPRVLWLGVAGGVAEISDVQKIVQSRVAAAGLPVEKKPFHPHLTLARFRDIRPSMRRELAELSTDTRWIARLPVREVILFESRLPAGRSASGVGPTYTAVTHAVLRCS